MEVLYEKCDEQNAWLKYNSSVLKAAEEMCGTSKGRPQHGETWWWNQDVKKPSQRKRKVFRGGSNFHRLKINLAISLTKRKPRELLLRQ